MHSDGRYRGKWHGDVWALLLLFRVELRVVLRVVKKQVNSQDGQSQLVRVHTHGATTKERRQWRAGSALTRKVILDVTP